MVNPCILALSRNQSHHYEPFAALLRKEFDFIEDSLWDPQTIHRIRPAILLTLTDTWYEAARCIQQARALSIPTLLIMDGIIEWRHTWQDPKTGACEGVPIFQPVLTDKIACLGKQSARIIESWGNQGKCEVVGAPRMDHFLDQPVPPPPHEYPFRLLVATANTPGFTSHQVELVKKSLADLRDALMVHSEWRVSWRVNPEIKRELQLQDTFLGAATLPLKEALAAVDAVITTPSTLQLEAMLAKRPTALLDYSNSPHYVECAWSITSQTHISTVLSELAAPSYARLMWQDYLLHDNLECRSPASNRMATLIRRMIAHAEKCLTQGLKLHFPPALLEIEESESTILDLSQAYPGNPSYGINDVHELQRRLAFAQQEIRDLRRQLFLEKVIARIFRRIRQRSKQ